jgi:hypothetical protein
MQLGVVVDFLHFFISRENVIGFIPFYTFNGAESAHNLVLTLLIDIPLKSLLAHYFIA